MSENNEVVSNDELELPDPITYHLFCLRKEIDQDYFDEFVRTVCERTRNEIVDWEYQVRLQVLIPRHQFWRVNRLMRAIMSVENPLAVPFASSEQFSINRLIHIDESERNSPTSSESERSSPSSDISLSGEEEEADDEGERISYEQPRQQSQQPKEIKGKSKIRSRNEWTVQEDNVFLEGLRLYGRDFGAIASILPSRSRYQIRTHYAYFAKSIVANNSRGKPVRRLKTRGRPPKGNGFQAEVCSPTSNQLLLDLMTCISHLEATK